ncbi:MAG: protein kinase [Planctomycetota bacterium]
MSDHWKGLRFNRLDFDRAYVVDQVLSQTPRSRVFLVRRRGGSQQTVMKLRDRTAVNRLETECLRSLRHPGIASYLGHGVTRDRRQWLETEYIDGEPLTAWLDKRTRVEGKPDESVGRSEAVNVFLQLVSIVQYLHCCGWLHGDLSPQNILVSTGKRGVVLIDFEHARESGSSTEKVMPRKHSLSYASPHELAGGRTTEACEQFALGKLGFLMLGPCDKQANNGLEMALSRATAAEAHARYTNLFALAHEVQTAAGTAST